MCFFGKQIIGLDIADRSIEVALLRLSLGRMKIVSLAREVLPAGIVEEGRVKDKEKLKEAINQIMKTAKPHAIKSRELVVGLPERQVFLHQFHLPPHNRRERDKMILGEVIRNIPVSENNLVYSYRIRGENKEGVNVLLAGSKKDVVKEWSEFFSSIGYAVNLFDIEILATFRGLGVEITNDAVVLVDIGSKVTQVAVFDKSGLLYEQAIPRAGEAFTSAVAEAIEVDRDKSELEKIKIGLKGRNKTVVAAISHELDLLIQEIKDTMAFVAKEKNTKVATAVLVGGSSQMLGLVEYFSAAIKIPTTIGTVGLAEKSAPLEYVEAVGLAKRGLDKSFADSDPEIKV